VRNVSVPQEADNGLTAASDWIVGIVVRLVAAHVISINEPFFPNPTARVSMWQTLAAQHRCDTFVRWRHEVVALMQKSKELIEAVPKGVIVRRAALMPFADQPSRVTSVLQRLGNRDFRNRQTEARLFIERTGGIELITEACWDPPGKQTRAGRTAVGSSNIPFSEPYAIGGYCIDVGCRDLWISLAAKLSIAQVIGKKDNNIWSFSRPGNLST